MSIFFSYQSEISDKQIERFHPDISVMKAKYQGLFNPNRMNNSADFNSEWTAPPTNSPPRQLELQRTPTAPLQMDITPHECLWYYINPTDEEALIPELWGL